MPRLRRAMHTPSKAWTRSRVPSITLTLTRDRVAGAEVGDRRARRCRRSICSCSSSESGSSHPRLVGAPVPGPWPPCSALARGPDQIRPPGLRDRLRLLAVARRRSWRDGPTTARRAPRAPPTPAAWCSGGIPAGPSAKLSSASEAAVADHAGQQTHAGVDQDHGGKLAARQHEIAERELDEAAGLDHAMVDALVAAAQQHDARARPRARARAPGATARRAG